MPSDDKITLIYFDLAGGGEPIRLAFHIGGIEFEDRRISFKDWPEIKKDMPLGQLPVLEVNGKVYTQCLAMLRFAADKAGFAKKTPEENFRIDEMIYALQDLTSAIGNTIHMEDNKEREDRRIKWLTADFPTIMMYLDKLCEQQQGDDLTIADLQLYSRVNWWSCGVLKNIPKECCAPYKNVLKRVELVRKHPRVIDWVSKHMPKTSACS
eukprot:TRINITY_DN1593_c1_g1_i2.p1 TRINITY_DN1593_c1_g1~~TRINITY_DN1593_c1_g1_i2.p1  ORF type:complete len:236 (+),score=39.42 TRINITY_DN1593_c1_g1_i2:79-708(+)